MPDHSRYLELERRIQRGTSRSEPGCLLPGDAGTGLDDWTGTADRLPPPSDRATPTAGAFSNPMVARAFDDGAPIELHYDHDVHPRPLAPGAEAAPEAVAPPEVLAPPEVVVPPRVMAPQPSVVPPAVMPPAPARTTDDLAAIDDDADFAQHLRQLVDRAGAPTQPDRPTAPSATAPAATPPSASPAPEPEAEAPAATADRYQVFDRIGESLSTPRTFDLGAVPVEAAFDAIERAMDRGQRPRPARSPSPPALDDVDFAEDFAMMPVARSASAVSYRPAAPDTLLVGQREMPAPAGVTVRNWAASGVTPFTSDSRRPLSDVRQIVIHETASRQWDGIADPDLGVQFHLDRDGTLVQHNDVLDMLWHVKTFSPHAVGIEVVSLVFDTDATPDKGEKEPGDRIPIAWGGQKGPFYVVPPAAQMEALAQTVAALRRHLAVPDTWLQVMPHPDPARAAGDLRGRTFFLMSTAGHLYFTAATADAWIASHSVLRDHQDGAFPTLYCYLRLHKAMAPADAYQMARQIAEDPGGHRRQTHFDKTSGATLQLLDITDVA